MTNFDKMRPKTYCYSTDNNHKNKKAKITKKCVVKKLKGEDYKHCLEANQLENKINQLEKNNIDVNSLGENHKYL